MSMSTATTIETGPWAGWKTWPQDKFETGTGPFYARKDETGRIIARFIAEPRHMNGGGFMHGGCLLTFADYTCFAIADEIADGPSVTVNLSGDFLAPARLGDMMEAAGEVTRAGARLIYVRGLVTANGKPCLSFTSVITRVGAKAGPSTARTSR
jgi:acyl-coenzyme A thioesterase PaaI-like protein